MRAETILLVMLLTSAMACGAPAAPPRDAAGLPTIAATRPAPAVNAAPSALGSPLKVVTTSFTGSQVADWTWRDVDGQRCMVSKTLSFGHGYEVNHHRVAVTFTGKGSVKLGLAHSRMDDVEGALRQKHLHSGLWTISKSGGAKLISSPYRAERYAWLIVQPVGNVRITGVRHTCLRGKGTLYGHVGGFFEFRRGKLPFRLMFPRNYDPRKKYPLVLSVSGSGGVGTHNVRNMEMVILARYLFTRYYFQKDMECFSLVPQIPPKTAIPQPYWPKGKLGAPTPLYHPDWPAVNENGWYTRATLALIRSLIEDEGVGIDPDRVYYSGFSYGGKACWEFLRAGREVFAAGMCGGSWPIGRAYCNPTRRLLKRLKLEVRRHKHIPVFIFSGGKDPMRFGSRAIHKEILAQGGKSTYVEFPGTTHVSTAGKGWGRREYVAWLFKQNRKKNPKPGKDPFAGGVYPPQGGNELR